jgi:type IV pilus assembly protein PilA
MLTSFRKRIERDEDGFTLIELMVVVLIIAILIAIAIPTFLGARERAQDRAAQSDIRNAFTAEKVVYTDDQAYTTDATVLNGIEPSLDFSTAAALTPDAVHVDVTTGVVTLAKQSASGTCFYLRDTPTGAGAGTEYAEDSSSPCADNPGAALTWGTAW